MERRQAIKAVMMSAAGLITLPAWANSWNPQTVLLPFRFLNTMQESLLEEVVSLIIPEGEKPGAKSLGVHSFVQKMVADCYEPKDQEAFKTGLDNIEKTAQLVHNQSFTALNTAQKEEILSQRDAFGKGVSLSTDAQQKEFFASIKNLTIQGYTSSEYVMVNHYNYEMAPGHFYGCITV